MTDRWLNVSAAPHDGTPVILWLEDPEAPPAFPVTVGVWEIDEAISPIGFWRVLGAKGGTTVYFDQQVVGWKPLPPASQETL